MNFKKMLLGVWLLVLIVAITGCNWFTGNQTRPAPVRPRVTSPTPKTSPVPTKNIPGTTAITEKHLYNRLNRIESAAKKRNWPICNRETNLLGTDMTRYRPSSHRGKSLKNIAAFDATYAKLQANVKSRNHPAVVRDVNKLRDDLRRIKSIPRR